MALATRMEFGRELIKIGKEREDFVVFSADTKSCGLENFGKLYPGREYGMGIAEQDMMCAAAGFASCGHKVYAVTYAVFASMRACEQVRTFICYPNLDVTIVASHAGLQVGPDGATHMSMEDVSIMRSFPNMTIIQPSDDVSARAAARAAADFHGPLYVKLHRDPLPTIHDEANYELKIGKANVLCSKGEDAAIFATGAMVHKALHVADELWSEGIGLRVYEMHTLKPIDAETVLLAAKETGAILTLEDHTVLGGLGSAVSQILSESLPTRMKIMGVQDVFGESGDSESLYAAYGLGVDDIKIAVKELIHTKIT